MKGQVRSPRSGTTSDKAEHPQRKVYMARLVSLAEAVEDKIKSSSDFEDTVSIFDDLYLFDSEGWKITRKLIIKLHSEVRENGGKLAVVHFGGNQQQHQQSKIHQLPIKQFDRFLSDQGIEHLNAFELFSNMKDTDLENYFIPNDGHFSEAGHAKFAGLAMELLVRLLQTKI